MMTDTHTLIPTLDCLHKHTFLFHAYRSVFLTRMQHYTQLAYLFHQCGANLLSGDSRIADCTMRHPGFERPLSSVFGCVFVYIYIYIYICVCVCVYVYIYIRTRYTVQRCYFDP